jgi:hypothetical protein
LIERFFNNIKQGAWQPAMTNSLPATSLHQLASISLWLRVNESRP